MIGRGADVSVIARGRARLEEMQAAGAKTLAGDATDAAFMQHAVRATTPDVLILNAGAPPVMGPVDGLGFEDFSANWNCDVKAGLAYLEQRYGPPLTPAHLGAQVADILADPGYLSGVAYGLTREAPIGLDT